MGHTLVRKYVDMETGEEEFEEEPGRDSPPLTLKFESEPPSSLPQNLAGESGGTRPQSLSLDQVRTVGGLINRSETLWLMELVETAPSEGAVVDLGTLNGLSCTALCAVVGDERVTTIDHWECHAKPVGAPERNFESLKALGLNPRFKDSESWQVPEWIDQVAMIFIDTTHEEQVLKSELAAWLPLLTPGGVVALHDYDRSHFTHYTELIDQVFIPPLWKREGLVGTLIAFRRTP